MTHPEAIRLVAMLAAYWRTDVPDETAALWANRLIEFETQDGMEAAHIIGGSGRFFPSLADFVDTIRECRRDRILAEHRELPAESHPRAFYPFAQFLADYPEWADRVRALDDKTRPFPGEKPCTDLGLEMMLEGELR